MTNEELAQMVLDGDIDVADIPKVQLEGVAAVLEARELSENSIASIEQQDREANEAAGTPEALTSLERVILTGQGLTFDWGDELVARVKSISPNLSYEEALAFERQMLNIAREKPGSLKYELAGSLIPTLVGLSLTPFTGGASGLASVPALTRLAGVLAAKKLARPGVGRLAKIGAVEGAAFGAGASEEQGLQRISDVPVAAFMGAVANPVFAKIPQVAARAASPMFDWVRRKYLGKVPKVVEEGVAEVINKGDLEFEEIIARVRRGETFPEMSEEATKAVADWVKTGGIDAQRIVRDAMGERQTKVINDLWETMQEDLAPGNRGKNIFETFGEGIEDLKAHEKKVYDDIFNKYPDPIAKGDWPIIGNREVDELVETFINNDNRRKAIENYFKERMLSPIFKKSKDGGYKLTRQLNLRDAEDVVRAIRSAKERFEKDFTKYGPGDVVTIAFKDSEDQLKRLLDSVSGELRETRRDWAIIEDSVKKYKDGLTAFSAKNDPEQFSLYFNNIQSEVAKDAYRVGALKAMQAKFAKPGTRRAFLGELADTKDQMTTHPRRILNILYPDDALDNIADKLSTTVGVIQAAKKPGISRKFEKTVIKGKPGQPIEMTASVTPSVKQSPSKAKDLIRLWTSGGSDIDATRSLLANTLNREIVLSDKELKQMAEVIVTDNADILLQALTDGDALSKFYNIVNKVYSAITLDPSVMPLRTSQARAWLGTEMGEPVEELVNPVIKQMSDMMTPKVKAKVRALFQ